MHESPFHPPLSRFDFNRQCSRSARGSGEKVWRDLHHVVETCPDVSTPVNDFHHLFRFLPVSLLAHALCSHTHTCTSSCAIRHSRNKTYENSPLAIFSAWWRTSRLTRVGMDGMVAPCWERSTSTTLSTSRRVGKSAKFYDPDGFRARKSFRKRIFSVAPQHNSTACCSESTLRDESEGVRSWPRARRGVPKRRPLQAKTRVAFEHTALHNCNNSFASGYRTIICPPSSCTSCESSTRNCRWASLDEKGCGYCWNFGRFELLRSVTKRAASKRLFGMFWSRSDFISWIWAQIQTLSSAKSNRIHAQSIDFSKVSLVHNATLQRRLQQLFYVLESFKRYLVDLSADSDLIFHKIQQNPPSIHRLLQSIARLQRDVTKTATTLVYVLESFKLYLVDLSADSDFISHKIQQNTSSDSLNS